MKLIAERITDSLATSKIIPNEDKELYVYGFHQGFVFLFNILTMCLLGHINGMLGESLIFLLAYMPLRSYAGGYHAKTPFGCYLISIIMMMIVLWVIRLPFCNTPVTIAVLMFAVVVIMVLAPVEDPNKPLDIHEKTVYKKRTISILIGLNVFGLLMGRVFLTCIAVALATLALMLIVGKIKNGMLMQE